MLSPHPQILLLDLSTGSMLWSQSLPSLPGGPPSTSLMTADHRSAFFFWGLHELVGTNEMVWSHMFREYPLLGSGSQIPLEAGRGWTTRNPLRGVQTCREWGQAKGKVSRRDRRRILEVGADM